jgi:hypothetical protein
MAEHAWLNRFLPTWAWFVLLAIGIYVASIAGKALHPDATALPQSAPIESTSQPSAPAQSSSQPSSPRPLYPGFDPSLWPPKGTPSFDGEPCSRGCSGLLAGYDWAEKNSITDKEDCNKAGEHYNSPYFASGCRRYIDDGRYENQ